MAVELRCPECKSKLRLPEAPDPDAEVECPKCGNVFPGEQNIVRAGSADEDVAEKPVKKKPAADKGDDKPKKKEKKEKKKDKQKKAAAGGDRPKQPKKRKGKKRKTPPAVIAGIIVGVLMLVSTVGGVLIWFFTKKSASQEMMTYLPDDCDEVTGVNLGHMQKYPAFYKTCEGIFAETGFKKAGAAFCKAIGTEFNDTIEYVVQGTGTTVLRTKVEYDQGLLSKMPGAKKYTASGVDYFTVDDPGIGYAGLRVFAPTNRIVVFGAGTLPQAKFNAMLVGNKDNLDGTPYYRAGPLAKQTIRGTAWKFCIYGNVSRPAAPPAQKGGAGGGSPSDEDQLLTEIAGIASSAQGSGYKASVGSRAIRGEWIVWYKESAAASDTAKKWKEKDWVKDDEKEPPRWWKTLAQKSGGGRTAPNAIKDNLGFSSSGELFFVRTELETKLLESGVGSLVGVFTQQTQSSGAGTMPGGAGAGGGGPGVVAAPGPGGGVVMPGPRRRRLPGRLARKPLAASQG